ncbi:CRISPR-associated endonuclease Cas3'' [Kytococcus schroeteri]|uniref:CRISPR-associated endonuclease Cas3 n=1 Tax=Kytococcus schroeteri TaxID=138300 RepID=A0A2I1PAB0_9MICO|nr:CRISPR-associated endonuclease Cas3'' [Kytococcus schroeteri]PKZ41569.1 CRISPR-associated endonuclease Cas3'' [Kytococcus schroeteri]
MTHTFTQVFEAATGSAPYDYQCRIAKEGLPPVLTAATGAGKTAAIVLGWLYRRQFADLETRRATPRRLVIAQPMRTLTEQTARSVRHWLEALAAAGMLQDEVDVHELMGGLFTRERQRDWRMSMARDAVVVGTVDAVVSRALFRGYGARRPAYPMEAALVLNGAHLVVDEMQLAEQATATLRQVAAFQASTALGGTSEPAGLTCMSATPSTAALDTVDFRFEASQVMEMGPIDGALARRLQAAKEIRQIPAGKTAQLADQVLAAHRLGTLTLVVLNTVDTAADVHAKLAKALNKQGASTELHLVHSQFRPHERQALMERLGEQEWPAEGTVVVATQAVEAGVDLDAATLVTEASPWPSFCQRVGRCNRRGEIDGARVLWFPALGSGPYEKTDLASTAAVLETLEGQEVTSPQLLSMEVEWAEPTLHFLRRKDLLALVDTAPDLSGQDLDVSRYIRASEDATVTVAWVPDAWLPGQGPQGGSVEDLPRSPLPSHEWRCPVPLRRLRKWAEKHPGALFAFDPTANRWRPVAIRDIRPGMALVAGASRGGYEVERGFSLTHKAVVEPLPGVNDIPSDPLQQEASDADAGQRGGVEVPVVLTTHLADAARAAEDLLRELDVDLRPGLHEALVAAARSHDVGKVHPQWQEFIHAAAGRPVETEGVPLAKSGGRSRARLPHGLRHEFVSALALQTEAGRAWLADEGVAVDDAALVRYLVGAHHGYVRIMPPNPTGDGSGKELVHWLGLQHGEPVPWIDPRTGERLADAGHADFVRGAARVAGSADQEPLQTWSEMTTSLLSLHGPFRLAWMEAVVRVADWRASEHPTVEEI